LIGFDPYEVTLSGQFTDGVVEGNYYQMRVRAHNVHGWGPFSEVLSIRAAGRPLEPAPPTTVVNNENIRVSWVDPIDSAEQITQYLILFANKDYINFEEIPDYCDGSDPVVL